MLDTYDFIAFSCFEDDIDTVLPLVASDESLRPVPTDDWRQACPLDPGIIYADAPNPGGSVGNRVVFFAPEAVPRRTVMFASASDGWPSLAYVLGLRLQGAVIDFALSSAHNPWPRNAFDLSRGGKRVRHISAMKDDPRWVFWQQGDVLPEEDAEAYDRRLVRDRFNREGVVGLARRLGWPIDQDDFWQSQRAHYFQQVFGDPKATEEAWKRKMACLAEEIGLRLIDDSEPQ